MIRSDVVLTELVVGTAHVPLVRLYMAVIIGWDEFSRRHGNNEFFEDRDIVSILGISYPPLEVIFGDGANGIEIGLY